MSAADEKLKGFIERIETLEGQKSDIADDIKDVYAEVKSEGYNPKALKAVITRRRLEREKVEALDADVSLYEERIR